MINQLKDYIMSNGKVLFKKSEADNSKAVFDKKGFFFETNTQLAYDNIKSLPHLYVAYTKNVNGYLYVGKSFQNGGRWKRQHAYHLGTLAHQLLNTIRNDDQNHSHWIESWMQNDSIESSALLNQIKLKEEVYITFLPINLYSRFQTINKDIINYKKEIRQINKEVEMKLIKSYLSDGYILLNKQGA